MNNKLLLIENLLPTEANLITETAGTDVYLRGIFMQSSIKNRNGRNYPLKEIQSAVKCLYDSIAGGNPILGELDHPQTLQINLDRVSHAITEIKMEGNNAVGKLKLLETPMGKIAREICKAVRIGISSRGAGSVMAEGDVSGFTIVTCDLVATPSAPGAILSIGESLDSRLGAQTLSLAESLRHDPSAQKYFQRNIVKLITEMLNK